MDKPLLKSFALFVILLAGISASFTLVVMTHDDSKNRVKFSLLNQSGQETSERDLAGRYSLVYFGFTSCNHICPMHMVKLTEALRALDASGHGTMVRPVFISIDPERDSPSAVGKYLENFDARFIGLTGDRAALESAARSFKTFLPEAPRLSGDEHRDHSEAKADYQLTHSTLVYVLDPFGRIVDYISAEASGTEIAERFRKMI